MAREAASLRAEALAVMQLEKEGAFSKAIERAAALASKHPSSPLALNLVGRLHHAVSSLPMKDADKVSHLCWAEKALRAAAGLAPDCVAIATALGNVLKDSGQYDEAEREFRRAMSIALPLDPAVHSVSYGLTDSKRTTANERVLDAKQAVYYYFDRMVEKKIRDRMEEYAREEVCKVLAIGKHDPASALREAKRVAQTFEPSPRAQYLRAYMELEYVRQLDPAIDKRKILLRTLDTIEHCVSIAPFSVVISCFRAKLLFLLQQYDLAYCEGRRAVGLKNPDDPKEHDIPPGSVNEPSPVNRTYSVLGEFYDLFNKIALTGMDYWRSMSTEKQDGFLSVRVDALRKYYNGINEPAARTISDAQCFVKKHNSWRFWICPLCDGKKFTKSGLLLSHMCSKHPRAVLPKMQSVLDEKLSDSAVEGDGSLDGISLSEDSDHHDIFHLERRNDISKWLFNGPSSGVKADSFAEIRDKRCKTGTEILEDLKKKMKTLPTDKSSTELALPEIQELWTKFLGTSIFDYREIIFPLLQSYLWEELKKCMTEDVKSISADDIDAIFGNVAVDSDIIEEWGLKPSLSNIGHNQQTENQKPSHSEAALKIDNTHQESNINKESDLNLSYAKAKHSNIRDDQLRKNHKPSRSDKAKALKINDKRQESSVNKKSGSRPSNSKTKKQMDYQQTENQKPARSDEALKIDNKYQESDAHVEHENSETAVKKNWSDPSIHKTKDGKKLDAKQANLELDLQYNGSVATSQYSSSAQNYTTYPKSQDGTTKENKAIAFSLLEHTEKMASTSNYRRTIDALNEDNTDDDLFFLNVIIQSMWHLRLFRDELLRRPPVCFQFNHAEGSCMVVALYEIFCAWEKNEHHRTVVLLASLKTALCNIINDRNVFQKVEINFASEIVALILEILHMSETSLQFNSNANIERRALSSSSCRDYICRAHNLFGMNLHEQMSCTCGKWACQKDYTSFFHEIIVSSPQVSKIKSFAKLLRSMDQQLLDDNMGRCCQNLKNRDCFLSNPPHFFTSVLSWLSSDESEVSIFEVLVDIISPLDIGLLFKGVHSETKYSVASLICYADQGYVCFAHDQNKWLIYDAKTVEAADSWEHLLQRYRQSNLRPEVIFFEVIK